jgi:hypothetical protein
MAIDALSSVPLGRSDTGEAVVLGKGNFEDFTRDILKIRQKEGEERKQTNAEIGKLLQDQYKPLRIKLWHCMEIKRKTVGLTVLNLLGYKTNGTS